MFNRKPPVGALSTPDGSDRQHRSLPRVLARRFALLTATAAMVFASATMANASTEAEAPAEASTEAAPGTAVTSDRGWQQFETAGGIGGTSVDGPFTFETTALTKVTVTDSFCHGDEFSLLDNGAHIGDTSAIPEELRTCPTRFYRTDTVRADASMLDATFSQGTFYVAPGSHSLEFVNKAIWNGTDAGTKAYFRLETVQLDKTDCKAGGWESFGVLFSNQGECVSLANSLQHMTAVNVGPVTFATSPFGTAARGLPAPSPNWHKWTGNFLNHTTYTAFRTTPITQADPGFEVLTTTVPVALSSARHTDPATATVTLTMTPQDQITALIAMGQYGSLGNTAWELIDGPVLSVPSMETTWTFQSTAPLAPGMDYDPIVISFNIGDFNPVTSAVYNFFRPATAIVSAVADGYLTGTGSAWYRP